MKGDAPAAPAFTPIPGGASSATMTSVARGITGISTIAGSSTKAVYRDVQPLAALGFIEKDEAGMLFVPFSRIRTEFDLAQAA